MKVRRVKWALWVLFVALFAFWWGVAVLASHSESALSELSRNISTTPVAFASPNPVVVDHAVVNGQHTYNGTLMLPDACDSLGSGLATMGEEPHVTIILTVTREASCPSVVPAGNSVLTSFNVGLTNTAKGTPIIDGVTINGVITPFLIREK